MTISLAEGSARDGTGGYTGNSFDFLWYTFGESDETTALAYVKSNVPATYRGFPLKTIAQKQLTIDAFEWKVNYSVDSNNVNQTTPILEFNVGGGSLHVTNSITHTRYRDLSVCPDDMNFGGAIGVELSDDGSKARVRGVDIFAPTLEYTYGQLFVADAVTDEYVDAIFALAGQVNDATFHRRPSGSVLFKGARGTMKGADLWEIRFDFAYSQNLTGLSVGGVTGITKDGWDYQDTLYVPNLRSSTGFRVLVPGQVTIHRVYYRGDFSVLGI